MSPPTHLIAQAATTALVSLKEEHAIIKRELASTSAAVDAMALERSRSDDSVAEEAGRVRQELKELKMRVEDMHLGMERAVEQKVTAALKGSTVELKGTLCLPGGQLRELNEGSAQIS